MVLKCFSWRGGLGGELRMLWSSRVCGTLFGLTKGQMRLLRELETGFWKELKKKNRSKERKISKRRGRVKGNDFRFYILL